MFGLVLMQALRFHRIKPEDNPTVLDEKDLLARQNCVNEFVEPVGGFSQRSLNGHSPSPVWL